MLAQGNGDIINISSTAGRRSTGAFAPYATSKFGLNGFTEALRQQVGDQGVRVCVIEPGATSTEVAESVANPDIRARLQDHVNKDGAMKPEDVAAAIVFVASLPARANVSEILIRPTIDTAPL
jgi:NADP-dependent 3-hydroxy acid dehydrogenase YdfG